MNPLSPKGQFCEVEQLQHQFHSNLLVPGFCIIASSKSNVNLLKYNDVSSFVGFFPLKILKLGWSHKFIFLYAFYV